MKYTSHIVLMAIVLVMLQGCALRKAKSKPASTSSAPTTTDQTGALSPPPFAEKTVPPPPPAPETTQVETTLPPTPPPQKKPGTKKKTATKSKPSAAKPATTATTQSDSTKTVTPATSAASGTPTPVQKAESIEPSGVSPIGQLSNGEGASGSQKRRETSDLINGTEQGVNGIKRALSLQEQETVTQIRTYLKQAKQALSVDDLDGASTLATKAKVLLEELTKP